MALLAGPAIPSMAVETQQDAILAWMQEVAPYGIFTTDSELRIRTWNRWLVSHSGLPAEVVVGRRLVDVFPDIHARRLDEYLQRSLGGEISVLSTALHKYLLPMPVTLRGYDIGHMLQTVRIAPLSLGAEIVGTITTIEDVTQRECQAAVLRRQQEHDRLHSHALALLLQAEDPLRVTAELFQHIAAPLKLEAYFQYILSPDGGELQLHASGGTTPEMRRAMARLRYGEGPCGQSAEQRIPVVIANLQSRSDGHTLTVRRIGLRCYAVFPLVIGERLLGTLSFGSYQHDQIAPDSLEFLGTIAQYLAVAIDRSLRENALEEARKSLSEHAGSLEARIAERTARLHETIAQLESFTYTVAHDLRAPIRALQGYSEILLNDYAAAIPPDGTALLRRIGRAGNRLDALTRDLLEFSRVSQPDVQLARVDLDELIHELVLVTPALQHEVLTIRPPLPPVQAQRTLLQQCLMNLFDNALKFTAPGVKPQILVHAELRPGTAMPAPALSASDVPPAAAAPDDPTPFAPRSGTTPGSLPPTTEGRVRIWIEDNGIGIAPEAQRKIFGIFERGSGVENVEGTGIGLAIVARAVQQMSGTCGVESVVGQGSRFWIELPAAE
jgi:signal transduction histidine kinase